MQSGAMQMAQRISPSMSIGPMSAPYVLVPLLAMAQEVNVSKEGSEPDCTRPFPEDMRLFDSALATKSGAPSPPLLHPLSCCHHDWRLVMVRGPQLTPFP